MEIIDSHQHLLFRDRLTYSWSDEVPELSNGVFGPDEYASLVASSGIETTIFMEVAADDACYQDEARHVATLIGENGLAGQIASCRPEIDQGFDAWIDECDGLGVVGYRRVLHVVPDDISQSTTFRRNLDKIGQKGLPFDLCFLARQLDLAEDLIRAHENQFFVLDHCGVPDIAAGEFEEWAQGMKKLAALPNLAVKFSGVSAYCARGEATIANIRPWVEYVIETFGPGRMLWGGDWPVVNLGCGLPDWIAMSRELIAELSDDEQRVIMSENARKIYGI